MFEAFLLCLRPSEQIVTASTTSVRAGDSKPRGTSFPRQRLAATGWTGLLLLLICYSIWLRIVDLGRIPGINGDEAWYGVQMLRLAAGEHVSWRTPTGNLMGPIQPAVLFGLQLFTEPSFTLLRVPAVLSGILAILLGYVVLRRHFDAPTGWIGATLTATVPTNIAYSRFGWDVSHSALFAFITLYLALAGSMLGATLCFGLLLWIHPTNVFAAPFFLLVFAGAEKQRSPWARTLTRTALLGLFFLCVSVVVVRVVTSRAGAVLDLSEALKRMSDIKEWGRFAVLLERFLTGDVTYEYVAGNWMGALPNAWDLLIGGLCALAFAVALSRLRPLRASACMGILAGFLATVLAFGIVVGTRGITPHTERYGYSLLVPALSAGSVVLRALGGSRAWPAYALTALLAGTLLWHFDRNYMQVIARTGSTSHPTFWTGEVEPKDAAVKMILADVGGRRPVTVIADGWWTFWPVAYLLHGKPGVNVLMYEGSTVDVSSESVYMVGFPGGPLEPNVLGVDRDCATSFFVPGYARAVALKVWRWNPSCLQYPIISFADDSHIWGS